jgi:hypothetical protein
LKRHLANSADSGAHSIFAHFLSLHTMMLALA